MREVPGELEILLRVHLFVLQGIKTNTQDYFLCKAELVKKRQLTTVYSRADSMNSVYRLSKSGGKPHTRGPTEVLNSDAPETTANN